MQSVDPTTAADQVRAILAAVDRGEVNATTTERAYLDGVLAGLEDSEPRAA
ncbi:hypothetical protein [Pseudonocardia alni]|uniref:hypothetical protein n=1 Tax=Pseudonocardia alni TaxID=33907 RepID=UPI00341068A3